ncbi:MAG: hypothetical protein ACK55I_04255, partial [bacterium]
PDQYDKRRCLDHDAVHAVALSNRLGSLRLDQKVVRLLRNLNTLCKHPGNFHQTIRPMSRNWLTGKRTFVHSRTMS